MRQPGQSFLGTFTATMTALSSHGIIDARSAAEALRTQNLHPEVVSNIKRVYGKTPAVKKALAAIRPS